MSIQTVLDGRVQVRLSQEGGDHGRRTGGSIDGQIGALQPMPTNILTISVTPFSRREAGPETFTLHGRYAPLGTTSFPITGGVDIYTFLAELERLREENSQLRLQNRRLLDRERMPTFQEVVRPGTGYATREQVDAATRTYVEALQRVMDAGALPSDSLTAQAEQPPAPAEPPRRRIIVTGD